MGSSNYGKGDTSRSGLRGDMKGGGYQASGTAPKSAPGKTKNLAGSTSIASAPTTASGKVNSAFAENRGRQPAWGSMSLTSRMTKHQTAPYVPGDYAAYRKTLPGFVAVAKGKKPTAPVVAAVVKPPAKKPVVKPTAVVSNVVREKLSPTKAAPARNMPLATRFGVVTGAKTGTQVSGGGGYGGGGTRGGSSLSGGGSGSRSAGTSRTGGTRGNNPVRG